MVEIFEAGKGGPVDHGTLLLRKHGDTSKLKSKSDRELIDSSSDPEVIRIYNMPLETGRGVDQESLLLSHNPNPVR